MRDVILKIERDLSNSIKSTSIYGVRFTWTTLYRRHRDQLNSTERMRRMAQKINFDQLKDNVLKLRDLNKASKTVILNEAAEYARQFGQTDLELTNERERLARRNGELRQMLELAKMEYFEAQNKAFEYFHYEI